MSLLVVSELTLRIAGRTLLDRANFRVENGQKIGIVGQNGVGKSTLFAAIGGALSADDGTIIRAKRMRMAQVEQESSEPHLSLLDTVLAADRERTHLLQAVEAARDPSTLAEAHERLIAIQAHAAPSRARRILAGMGFEAAAMDRPLASFSGGWRRRVALASALFLAPDLLLLDEPTNHLDLEATLWLEDWLRMFSGAALIISHDRSLLNRCVGTIAHFDQSKITLSPGGYDAFIRLKSEREMHQNRAAAKVAAQRAHLQQFIDRFKAKATKARQAQARVKALERLPIISTIEDGPQLQFSFPSPPELPPPMIRLEDVAIGYGTQTTLSHLTIAIDPGDRIALLGKNGQGKSTFLRFLAGDIAPQSGQVKRLSGLKVGHFAQHQDEALDRRATPIQHLTHIMPGTPPTAIRAQLARFGLDATKAETLIADLSGGEKTRLLLATATRKAPHLLLLDEPTNHLDITARDALIQALNAFSGAVILVSHDTAFIETTAEQLWCVDRGRITPFTGDLDDYRTALLARDDQKSPKEKITASREEPKNARQSRAAQRQALGPLKKELQKLEREISDLTHEKQKLESHLANPDTYLASNSEALRSYHKQLAEISSKIQDAEIRWLVTAEAFETANSDPF